MEQSALSMGGFIPLSTGNELNTKTAAQDPNCAPEMKRNPERNKDVQTVRDTINAVISGPQQDNGTEAPISTQPVNGATTPPTAAEGTDSTPEGKQPTQSETAPQTGKLRPFEKLLRIQREMDEKEAKKKLENQLDGMDWLPR